MDAKEAVSNVAGLIVGQLQHTNTDADRAYQLGVVMGDASQKPEVLAALGLSKEAAEKLMLAFVMAAAQFDPAIAARFQAAAAAS
jgi:hypothetical protein